MKIYSKLNTHIGKNLISNIFGVGVNLVSQIVLVPFYLHFWGIEKYGDWIILSTISSFFLMSDIGFNSVIGNIFSIKFVENKYYECQTALTNNFLLLLVVMLFSFFGMFVFCGFFDVNSILGIRSTSLFTTNFVLFGLLLQIFVSMITSVFNSIFRSVGKTYFCIYLDNIARLVEALITFSVLFFGLDFKFLVVTILLPRIFFGIYKYYQSKKYFKYNFRIKDFDLNFFKKVFTPSISFMSFPLGMAILNQGFTLLVNKNFSANGLVLFNTTRTLANFVKTLMGVISTAVWPEISLAFGNKNFYKLRDIHKKALFSSIAISLIAALFLLVFGNFIYDIWTKGKIVFDFYLMFSFLIIIIVNNIWYTSSVTLMATNNHSVLGVLFIISTIISMGLAIFITKTFHNLHFTVLCMLVVDVILVFYTIRKSLEITQDTVLNLFNIKTFTK